MSILHDLVVAGNALERIRELLTTGENPNSINEDGNTPLHFASIKLIKSPQDLEENLQVARELINFGAGVDVINRFEFSPLHYAVVCQKLEMVQCLLQANAQIDIRNNRNETPLILAVKIQNFQIVKELLNQQASVNLFDSRGNSAMHYALYQPSVNVNIVLELLIHGCEHTVLNKNYEMPLDFYVDNLVKAPCTEVFKARYLLKLFLLKWNFLNTYQEHLLNIISLKNQCQLHRFYFYCSNEIARTKCDYLSPDCTVYGIALRGFNYSLSKINNHIPFHIYDQVLDRLIMGKYPVYHDIIVSGICTNYLKKKFADRCCCVENSNRGLLNFDTLYLISSYLSHLDMLNMIIVYSSGK